MQTKSPLGAKITPVPPVYVFVGPCSMELGGSHGWQHPKDHPGAESTTFLCNDLTKYSATSADSSCGLLVFQPMCSLGDVGDNYVLYLK